MIELKAWTQNSYMAWKKKVVFIYFFVGVSES